MVGGHQRLVAARKLGLKSVPVVYLDVSPEQGRLLNLALSRISGQWDEELLGRMVADLTAREEFDLDTAWEQAQAAPGAIRGDLWRLGDHRLLCGDATDAGDMSRLLGGKKAELCFTDPPYSVALGDHGGQQRGARKRRIKKTPSRRRSGRRSAGAGRKTCWTRSTAPSTSA